MCHDCVDASERGARLRAICRDGPVDKLAIRPSARGLSSCQELDSFEEVGLSLSVLALDDGRPIFEIKRETAKAAVVGQLQRTEMHAFSMKWIPAILPSWL
jgi:hypothetical protein